MLPQKLTITEALAEIKTIDKRIEKKREFINTYLFRQDKLKDPLANEPLGSKGAIASESQAVGDLFERVLSLRRSIQKANENVSITVRDETRTIADWLVWRREILPKRKAMLTDLSNRIRHVRSQAAGKNLQVVSGSKEPATPEDVIVNVDEAELARDIEILEDIEGILDGQLSLRNAIVTVEV